MSKKLSKENPKFVPMDIIPFHPLLPIHNIFTVVNKKKEKQKQTGMVRRCILISDILENSISIPNIRYVVDPGLTTDRIYDANLGIESVKVAQISREKAKKRSNSISCSETGKCYRLYTQQTFKEEMEENSTPELLKANLASIILIFIKLQIKEVLDLDSQNIKNALEFLTDLGALRKVLEQIKLVIAIAKSNTDGGDDD
jgi:HrpA-like helicases